MTNALTGGALPKGQMEILATVRKKMSWQKEMEVAFEAKNAFEWADLVKVIPVEDVKIDENGQYDSLKYP